MRKSEKEIEMLHTFGMFLKWRDWINLKNSHRSSEFNNVYTRMRNKMNVSAPSAA